MSDKQTPDSTNLDREDPATLEQSTRRQWSLIGHLLHLPPLETIASEDQRIVAGRIANFMSTVRGGVADRALLRNELHEAFEARLENMLDVNEDNEPIRAASTNLNARTAEAWLQTIYAHFDEEELRNMIRELPASILPVTRDGTWQMRNITIGPSVGADFSINLSSPTNAIWKTGDRQAITRRLENRTLAQAGIVQLAGVPLVDRNYVLTTADIDAIFASTCNVVDPLLSLGQMQLENQPVRNEKVIIDLAAIVRMNPHVMHWNQAQMTAGFQTRLANSFQRFTRHVDMRNGTMLPPITNAQIPAIIQALFRQNGRDPANPFGESLSSLDDAIKNRQPVDRLVSGNASNRELILALAMIQRDPAAAGALEASQTSITSIRSRMIANDGLFEAAQAVKDLRSAALPKKAPNTIAPGIAAMNAIIRNASGTHAVGPVHLYIVPPAPGALPPDEHAEAVASRIPPQLDFTITSPVVLATPTTPAVPEKNNQERFNKIIEQAQKNIEEYNDADEKIQKIENILQTMLTQIQASGITVAQLTTGTNYATLARYIIGGGAFGVQRNQIDNRMNTTEVVRQFNRALREANPDSRTDLRDFSYYEKQRETIADELTKAEAGQKSNLNGSEACRAVVERGLSHEGLRDKELNDTVQYMFNSIQRNRESESDLRMYAERQFPDGEDDHEAEHHWEHGKSFTSFWTLGLHRRNFYGQYLQNLANDQTRFGFDLADHHVQNYNFNTRLLPNLIDIYFRTKAMTELDPHDPHYLPSSETVVRFQRQLYMHILDRAERSFNRSTGMNNEELNAFRAKGMNIDVSKLPAMTGEERRGYIRGFLNDTGAYMSDATNKKNFDMLVNRAYRPIQRRIDTHRRLSPATWALNTWNYVGKPVTKLLGITAAQGWGNKKNIATYAAIGAAATAPFVFIGAPIGAAYGFFKQPKAAAHGGHDDHGHGDDHGDGHGDDHGGDDHGGH